MLTVEEAFAACRVPQALMLRPSTILCVHRVQMVHLPTRQVSFAAPTALLVCGLIERRAGCSVRPVLMVRIGT